jgi:hypothetical protein
MIMTLKKSLTHSYRYFMFLPMWQGYGQTVPNEGGAGSPSDRGSEVLDLA